jgi:phosphohistidine phosphatase SixA
VAPKTIILMRHAEKPDDLTNPDLSHAGRERAKALATWIPQVCPNFDFLFASAISKQSDARSKR